MKKFKMLSAAALALILGACSSDAPDAPVASNEGDCFVTINLGGTSTRAIGDREDAADAKCLSKEFHIADFTLYLYDKNNNSYIYSAKVSRTADATAGAIGYLPDAAEAKNGGRATFKISSEVFTKLSGYAGSEVKYYLVCNTGSSITAPTAGNNDSSHADATIDSYTPGTNAGDFVMTSSGLIEIAAASDSNGLGTKESVWKIFGDKSLEVERIVSRIDYELTTDGATEFKYTDSEGVDKAQAMSVKVISCGVENKNNTVYFYPHFEKGGLTLDYQSTDPTAKDVLFSAGMKTFDPVSLGSTTQFTASGQYILPLTTTSKSASYQQVPYMVFKTKIEGYPAEVTSGMQTHTLYALNGYLLGDAAALENYKVPTGANYDVDADEVHGIYADAVANHGELSIDEYLIKKYSTEGGNKYLRVFQYNSVDQCHYVYYFHAIVRNNFTDLKTQNHFFIFGAQRNDIYDVKINQIKLIGYPGEYTPGDIYTEKVDNYFEMSIKVKNWKVVDNGYVLE